MQKLLAKNNIKSMLICFFAVDGIVHKEFVPVGQKVNGKFCCDILWWSPREQGGNSQTNSAKRIGFSTTTMHTHIALAVWHFGHQIT